jgi:hypothetical protein
MLESRLLPCGREGIAGEADGMGTRDNTITPSRIATCNVDTVWEDSPSAVHTSSTGSTASIGTDRCVTVDTNYSDHPSSIQSSEPVSSIAFFNYGRSDIQQKGIHENSQALTSFSDGNEFSSTQTLQPTLVPLPVIPHDENRRVTNETYPQTQYPDADGLRNSLQTMNPANTGLFSSIPTSMDDTYQNNWGFYSLQAYQAQMTYPQMAFNTVPSPWGYHPFQMHTLPRPRIYCAWPLCMESFARPGDLERHRQSVHLGIKHHCFWPGCHNNHGKGYVRCDKLRAHQKEKHGFARISFEFSNLR